MCYCQYYLGGLLTLCQKLNVLNMLWKFHLAPICTFWPNLKILMNACMISPCILFGPQSRISRSGSVNPLSFRKIRIAKPGNWTNLSRTWGKRRALKWALSEKSLFPRKRHEGLIWWNVNKGFKKRPLPEIKFEESLLARKCSTIVFKCYTWNRLST